jgi:hypothetical protein
MQADIDRLSAGSQQALQSQPLVFSTVTAVTGSSTGRLRRPVMDKEGKEGLPGLEASDEGQDV